MRELIAKGVCLLTLGVVTALSFVFASRHNRETPVAPASAPALASSVEPVHPEPAVTTGVELAQPARPPAIAESGRIVYNQQGCATCHSISGIGNPRSPLDGVGTRRSPADLRDWILGKGTAAERIPAPIVRRKQRYQSMPVEELDSLVAYLAGLTATR
jgi:mono/diheme cytochrome c family protein